MAPDKVASLVESINSRYRELNSLSDDELRSCGWYLKQIIIQHPDKDLNDHIVEAFALMKELAHRFSERDIIVHASPRDLELSTTTDFVEIKSGFAIYKNRWDTGARSSQWDMIHYDEQLMGGIYLHYGYALEMATGEGKTLVATLPAFLNALTGKGVHIMTANAYLSTRDYKITQPLYSFWGLTVDCIEKYPRCSMQRKNAYSSDITFGTYSGFTFDYLYDHTALRSEQCVQGNRHNYAIIDELDSVLIDGAATPHIISGSYKYDTGDLFKENLQLVKELISANDGSLFTCDHFFQDAELTEKGKEWISEKTGIKDLFRITRPYQVENFDQLDEASKTWYENIFAKAQCINKLLLALTVFKKDIHYVVKNDKVIIVDQTTGRLSHNSRWEHGLHTAIEVAEGVKPQKDSDALAVISLKNYFRLYSKISGMSGTILPVKDELEEIYQLKSVRLDTHNPIIRQDLPPRLFPSLQSKEQAIVGDALNEAGKGRPVLIGCATIKEAERLYEAFMALEPKPLVSLLDAKTEEEESTIIADAGKTSAITISTSMAGRGTDIKPSDTALAAGGLYVIGTTYFDSVRIDLQLKGRSGRQGNPGSSCTFASLEDDILLSLPAEKRHQLDSEIQSSDTDPAVIDNFKNYFDEAQKGCENHYQEQRNNSALKDDIIAPHRLRFYSQRNTVLHEASESLRIISEVLSRKALSEDFMEQHIQGLYVKAKEVLIKASRNDLVTKSRNIPFSENRITYVISLDMDSTLSSYTYFRNQFIRQNILQIYDQRWSSFVGYMMQDLTQEEISKLESIHNKLIADIDSELIRRVTQSSIPVGADRLNNQSDDSETDRTDSPSIAITRIAPDALCPCGSGKKYCECHGKGTHSINRRRR